MSEEIARIQPAAEIGEEGLKRVEELIEQEEGVQNRFRGRLGDFITAVAILMSLFHLYAAYEIVRTEVLRAIHVAFVLFLSFLIFPVSRRFRHRVMAWDWALAALGVAIALYLLANGDDFFDRSILPNNWDVVLAWFLVGGRPGSGVATTVTLGAVAYPMLAKVGYGKDAAGGLLAAGGLGAIISPPVLGAAAFLIAEFLKISYLDVILMATPPTCLYYLALFAMVEIDVRKFGMKDVTFERVESAWNLTRKYWFHFLSLVSIVVFMLWGFSAVLSVFWATIVSAVTSFLRRDTALIPYEVFTGKEPIGRGLWNSGLIKALSGGSLGVLNVAATCAGAGIIVGVVTLT